MVKEENLEGKLNSNESAQTSKFTRIIKDPGQWLANWFMLTGSSITWWMFYSAATYENQNNPWTLTPITVGIALLGLGYTVKNLEHNVKNRSGDYSEKLSKHILDQELESMIPYNKKDKYTD